MAAIKVKIFLTFGIPHLASLGFYGSYVKKRVYVKKFHLVYLSLWGNGP
jgi:hypothetical protein